MCDKNRNTSKSNKNYCNANYKYIVKNHCKTIILILQNFWNVYQIAINNLRSSLQFFILLLINGLQKIPKSYYYDYNENKVFLIVKKY